MYLVQIDHIVYRTPVSLVEAMRSVYGCGNARILRADGTLAVTYAGSSVEVMHAPTGRKVQRRGTRRARRGVTP